ncbi:MAG: type IX secretion system membrane protein PorP/SprF [Lentimicrobiaceae bacterium]|nr:type IX secretion system membrane protein PorP/SprF [Lentimicrobiaceae bacterium]
MKYLRIIAVVSALVMLCVQAKAQQEYQVSHNMFNHAVVNPGSLGSSDAVCITGLIRQQWVGFKDKEGNNVAPETFIFSADAPINLLHGGIGFAIYQDKLGFEKNIDLKIGYAYRTVAGAGDLGIGLNISMLNQSRDFSKYIPPDGKTGDPVLGEKGKESEMILDGGLGIYYQVPNGFYAGLSASQLLGTEGKTTAYKGVRHYYLTGGYPMTIPGHPAYEVIPSVFVKTDGTTAQYDINAMLKYNNKVWGGLTYRVQDAVVIFLGLTIKDLQIGYSYDLTTSKILGAGTSGSHEIMLRYCFGLEIEKHPRSYKNTRYL